MPNRIRTISRRLKNESTPLIDGNQAMFVWQGASAPQLMGDFCDWERGRSVDLEEIGPGVWVYRLQLPSDAYMEYAFWDGSQRYADPSNRRKVPNGLGKNNHYFYMPDGRPTDLARRQEHIPHGVISRHQLPTHVYLPGAERLVYLYQPPVDFPVPLLLVWDGKDYLHRAYLPEIVDNLVAQGRMQPVALAMVDNGRSARMAEYACSEATLAFLWRSLFPLAQAHLNLLDPGQHPGAWGLLGASMGGLMALYTALRMPEIFSHVLSQSGAFSLGEFDSIVFDLAANLKEPRLRIWMDVGIYDVPRLLEANRRMRPHLQAHGYDLEYREYPAGHNYPAWRDDLWRGLEALYGEKHSPNG